MADWYLYLIRCCDESLYTGIAIDVDRRFSEHQSGGRDGAKYLKGRGPLQLVFQQKVESRSMALKLEGRIKKLPKSAKERLLSESGYIDEIIARLDG